MEKRSKKLNKNDLVHYTQTHARTQVHPRETPHASLASEKVKNKSKNRDRKTRQEAGHTSAPTSGPLPSMSPWMGGVDYLQFLLACTTYTANVVRSPPSSSPLAFSCSPPKRSRTVLWLSSRSPASSQASTHTPLSTFPTLSVETHTYNLSLC